MKTSAKFALGLGIALGLAPAAAQEVRFAHAQGEAVLPAAPERLAVFDLPSLDIINALGKADLVVAAPKNAGQPSVLPEHLAVYDADAVAPAGTLFEPDVEALMTIAPDLIIIGGRSRGAYDAVSGIAPTIDMSGGEGDLAQIAIANTQRLGTLLGAEDAAAERIEAFEAVLANVRELGAEAGTGLVLFGAGQGFSAHAPGTRFGAVHDLVGIESVMERAEGPAAPRPAPGSPEAEAARERQQQALEAALAAEPDWIFTIDRGEAVGDSENPPLSERLAKDDRVTSTRAWQEGRVVHLDAKTWYLLGGGIDALTASAQTIAAAFESAK